MLKLLRRRVVHLVPVLLIVTFATFALSFLIPGDPAVTILGETASVDAIAELRDQLGFNEPILVQYGDWLAGIARGDFGESLFSSQPVLTLILQRLEVTVALTALAAGLTALVGIAAGIIAGANSGSWIDRLISAGTGAAIAIPPFWLGLLLVIPLAIQRDWLPASGYVPLSSGLWPSFKSLILPAVTLAVPASAIIARQLRAELRLVLDQNYIRTAQAFGHPRKTVVGKYALKNAMLPVVTIMGLQIGNLLGGSVIVEAVFALPGLGSLALHAVGFRDLPLLQGLVLLSALVVIVANLLVDLSYAFLNPKVKAS